MECQCPSCFDIYDDTNKIPRNMPCGHTYCEDCLNKWFLAKNIIECPACRKKIDGKVPANTLSKNFVAADLARKHRELQAKLQFCATHNDPLRFFCETDQVSLCAACIIEHSGHIFVKIEHSVHILKERTTDLKEKYIKKIEELEKARATKEKERNILVQNQDEQIKAINLEFTSLVKKLEEKKDEVLKLYQKYSNEQLDQVHMSLATESSFFDLAQKNLAALQKYQEELENKKVITNESFVKEINSLEDDMNQNLKIMERGNNMMSLKIPKVTFDTKNSLHFINNFCKISIDQKKNPKINFFGEKNKVLSYVIDRDEWSFQPLQINNIMQNRFEISYYSSAVTLPSGRVLITGGGINNLVYEVSLRNYKLIQKRPMRQVRKEHGSVYLDGYVFVLGGYDSTISRFLSSCERFDVKNNEWHIIKSMNIPKCAFATTTLNGKYIYTFGGYNGKERLNLIERYDYFKDEWVICELKLPQPFSNGACFSPSLNQIILLGGGYNSGFSLEVLILDVEKKTWNKLPKMSEGKDLRNKVVYLNDCIYAIGGNNFRSERFSFRKNMWENLKSYGFLVPDNLDSWSCALSFDQEDNDDIEDNIERSIFDENASEEMNPGYSDSGEINQNEEFDF